LLAVNFKVPDQLASLADLVSDVSLPGLTEIVRQRGSRGSAWSLRRLIRLVGLLSGFLAGGVAVFLQPFVRVWVGPRFVPGVFLVLVLSYLVIHHPFQHVLAVAMTAERRLGGFTVVVVLEAAVNLGLSISVVRLWGVAGVLGATAVAGWINV